MTTDPMDLWIWREEGGEGGFLSAGGGTERRICFPLFFEGCAVCAMLIHFSCIRLFVIPWTEACQASLSIGSSRQEYQSGLPCPSSGDLHDPGIEPPSLLKVGCIK